MRTMCERIGTKSPEKLSHGRGALDFCAHRQRIDEEPHRIPNPGNFRIAARSHDSDAGVALASGKQYCPGCLHAAGESRSGFFRKGFERASRRCIQLTGDGAVRGRRRQIERTGRRNGVEIIAPIVIIALRVADRGFEVGGKAWGFSTPRSVTFRKCRVGRADIAKDDQFRPPINQRVVPGPQHPPLIVSQLREVDFCERCRSRTRSQLASLGEHPGFRRGLAGGGE